MSGGIKTIGYAVREVGGLRCWFSKRDKRGVFLDTSKGKAKVYRTERGAASRAKWLNGLVYRYADGTRYEFAVFVCTASGNWKMD